VTYAPAGRQTSPEIAMNSRYFQLGQYIHPCQRCQKNVVMYRRSVKYCRPCAAIMDMERKATWAKKQPRGYRPLTEEQRQERKRREDLRRAHGATLTLDQESIWQRWAPEEPVEGLHRAIKIKLPFDYGLSKNAAWSMARGANYVYMKKRHSALRDAITTMIRKNLEPKFFVQGKIWLDILIQKPNHHGDAINMVDGIADAVKLAINIDDRWFCIRKLDWEIVKVNPMVIIGIAQAATEDQQICSYCGRILPLGEFAARKHGFMGRSRVCGPCARYDEKTRPDKGQ
jgi:hypothetical protein